MADLDTKRKIRFFDINLNDYVARESLNEKVTGEDLLELGIDIIEGLKDLKTKLVKLDKKSILIHILLLVIEKILKRIEKKLEEKKLGLDELSQVQKQQPQEKNKKKK